MGKQKKEVLPPKRRKSQNKLAEQIRKNVEILRNFKA